MLVEHNIQFIQGQVNKEINIIGTKPLDHCQLATHKHGATQAKGIARIGGYVFLLKRAHGKDFFFQVGDADLREGVKTSRRSHREERNNRFI